MDIVAEKGKRSKHSPIIHSEILTIILVFGSDLGVSLSAIQCGDKLLLENHAAKLNADWLVPSFSAAIMQVSHELAKGLFHSNVT